MKTFNYTHLDEVREKLHALFLDIDITFYSVYGVPRGGVVFAILISEWFHVPFINDKNDINENTLIVDDIIDSGKTYNKFKDKGCAFITIFATSSSSCATVCAETGFAYYKPSLTDNIIITREIYSLYRTNEWVHFFWEKENAEVEAEDLIIRQIELIGDNPIRMGLIETPKRVIKSWKDLFQGYKQKPEDFIKVFEPDDSISSFDEMIILKDIQVYSICEHHMLPFIGKAHVAYIPQNNKVLGISKIARIVNMYARRLQIQERLTNEITDCLMKYLNPLGAACVIEAEHFCMRMRGCNEQNSIMKTSSLKGKFIESEVRYEFMKLIK